MPQTSSSNDIPPYNNQLKPMFSPHNINIVHPNNQPKGHIILKRQTIEPTIVKELSQTARALTLAALRTLSTKPQMAKELT